MQLCQGGEFEGPGSRGDPKTALKQLVFDHSPNAVQAVQRDSSGPQAAGALEPPPPKAQARGALAHSLPGPSPKP